jgi:hypothetical protein
VTIKQAQKQAQQVDFRPGAVPDAPAEDAKA